MMVKMTGREFWEAAAQWGSYIHSGDPGACFYAFSPSGELQSEQHRQDCFAWLEECHRICERSDVDQLYAMRAYLKSAPVKGTCDVQA